jgi:hypothetical protein
VKRPKALEQAKAADKRSDLRRTSRGKTNNSSASRAPKRTSLEDASFVLTGNGIKNGGQAKSMSRSAKDDQSADGPRRVLVTQPKLQDIACTQAESITVQAKSVIGPRRVQASDGITKV